MNANKKFFSKIGFNYLAYSIASILFLIILSNIIAVIRPEILNNINIATIITAICNYVLPLPILLFLMRKLDSTEIKKNNLGFKTFLKYLCITFTLMWIGNITGTIITNLLSFTIQNDIANPIQNLINSTDLWLNLILISLIGPIFEEIIFRKILIDRTIKYGPLASILVSAIIKPVLLYCISWWIFCICLHKNRTNQIFNWTAYNSQYAWICFKHDCKQQCSQFIKCI